jgi:hypothetical protein
MLCIETSNCWEDLDPKDWRMTNPGRKFLEGLEFRDWRGGGAEEA